MKQPLHCQRPRGDGTDRAAAAFASGGHRLPPQLRTDFEIRLGRDLGHVRLNTSSQAHEAAKALDARAFTLGRDIGFARGAYNPGTRSGQHLIAHEVVHVLQQGMGMGSAVLQRQPTRLDRIPRAERLRIRVVTMAVTVPAARIAAYFAPGPGGRPGTIESVGARNSYGTGIAAGLPIGLGSVGAYVAGTTNALPLRSSVEVALDLSAHSGRQRRCRFTRFNHRMRGARRAVQVMLIEDVGAAVATPRRASVPTEIRLSTNRYPLTGRWQTGDYALLRQALFLLPGRARTGANGLTFRRMSGNAIGPEPGRYDETHDRVELFDNAFPAAMPLRYGGQPPAVRFILHEIAHALNIRPLEAEMRRYNRAGQTAASTSRLECNRSRSGSRFQLGAGGRWGRETHAADQSTGFRTAVRADGIRDDTSGRRTPEGSVATLRRGVTTYSDTDYEEAFAEAFALYVSDRVRLQALRPRTYAFFRRQYP